MNEIHGLDTSLELKYLLELPPEHAVIVREDLLRYGVSDHWIRTVDPTARPDDQPTRTTSKTSRGGDRKAAEKQKARSRHSSVQFLPNSIKLGTYGGGLYNVVMRRRGSPEGRETVCISMAKTAAAAVAESKDDRDVNPQTRRLGGGGGCVGAELGDDGASVTIGRCRCSSSECDGYKEVLRRYFVDGHYQDECDGGGHSDAGDGLSTSKMAVTADGCCGPRHRHGCVYKRIADVLLSHDMGSGDGTTTVDGGRGRDVAATDEGAGPDLAAAIERDYESSPSTSSFDAPSVVSEMDDDDDDDDEDDGSGVNSGSAGPAIDASPRCNRQVSPTTEVSPRPVASTSGGSSCETVTSPQPPHAQEQQAVTKKPTFFNRLLRWTKEHAADRSVDERLKNKRDLLTNQKPNVRANN